LAEELRTIVSCEHGGNRVPEPYRSLFAGQKTILDSHRGWDPGALPLARYISKALGASLHASRISRLLVDLNRSPRHPSLFSPVVRSLPVSTREDILDRYYWPYRRALAAEIKDEVEGGHAVLHLAIHTFTPVLEGEVRPLEMGILYDPSRARERAFSREWRSALHARIAGTAPGVRVRFNQPYRGVSDGIPTWLRRALGDDLYLGIEVEVSQGFIRARDRGWRTLRAAIPPSLMDALATRPLPTA
jgi:predicted N-formylglutamate amidohydrolase